MLPLYVWVLVLEYYRALSGPNHLGKNVAVWAQRRIVSDRPLAEGGLRLPCSDVRLLTVTRQEPVPGAILMGEESSSP